VPEKLLNKTYFVFHKIGVAKSNLLGIFFAKGLQLWFPGSLKFILMTLEARLPGKDSLKHLLYRT
jgi:hypothetical protein